jgi:putative hydroxymethylpyrimidine transport system substrate-binding protein
MRFCHSVFVLSLVALILLGCGGGSGAETENQELPSPKKVRHEAAATHAENPPIRAHLRITLAGRREPESAGIVMAAERGYFAETGLDVEVLSPVGIQRPIRYVVDGTDELGVSHQPQVALAKENGAPIVALGSVIPRPTATMIWLKSSKIHGIADLRGKTIAIPGLSFQKILLKSVLAQAGLTLKDVKVVNAGYDLTTKLIIGRADAIFGGYKDVEGVELESSGLVPVITPVQNLGVPVYEEMVWISRTDFASKHPRVIRDFMSAVRRGTAAAISNPAAAARMLEKSSERDWNLTPRETEAGLRAALPLLSKTGGMSRGKASRLLKWMHRQGFLQREIPVSKLLTNRYLLGDN